MYRYMQPPQTQQRRRKELADCRKRKPLVEDDSRRRTKMRLYKVKENANNNESSKVLQQGHGSRRRSGSPQAGFDPFTSNAHKNSVPILPPLQSKVVNWRLACFMAREYLSRGTLLGNRWPLPDSSARPRDNSKPSLPEGQERGNGKEKEKEGLYTSVTTDFLRSDDVHIPGILNPSQLADWIGFR